MMLVLTPEALDRARHFVGTTARPLERARLTHLVDHGSLDAVADELAAFRADDAGGGFGHALESDHRAPVASVLATLTALDILRMHGAPGDHPLVASACRWLVEHVETDALGRRVWPFLPPEAQAWPHAPWWDQSTPGELSDTFRGYVANPGVAITAHLWRHEAASPGNVPADLLAQLGAQAVAVAASGLDEDEVNAHDALAHLAAEPTVPPDVRAPVTRYLAEVLPHRVMAAPADFADYAIHPLWVAPTPSHPLASVIQAQVSVALDHTIATQSADGSWPTFWTWGNQPDEWARAEREWRGVLVVRNVHALLAHGRVA